MGYRIVYDLETTGVSNLHVCKDGYAHIRIDEFSTSGFKLSTLESKLTFLVSMSFAQYLFDEGIDLSIFKYADGWKTAFEGFYDSEGYHQLIKNIWMSQDIIPARYCANFNGIKVRPIYNKKPREDSWMTDGCEDTKSYLDVRELIKTYKAISEAMNKRAYREGCDTRTFSERFEDFISMSTEDFLLYDDVYFMLEANKESNSKSKKSILISSLWD